MLNALCIQKFDNCSLQLSEILLCKCVQQNKVSHKNQKCIEINVCLLQREKRRVLFLYNEALKRRRGLFKHMTAQVKQKVREHKLEVSKNTARFY